MKTLKLGPNMLAVLRFFEVNAVSGKWYTFREVFDGLNNGRKWRQRKTQLHRAIASLENAGLVKVNRCKALVRCNGGYLIRSVD